MSDVRDRLVAIFRQPNGLMDWARARIFAQEQTRKAVAAFRSAWR